MEKVRKPPGLCRLANRERARDLVLANPPIHDDGCMMTVVVGVLLLVMVAIFLDTDSVWLGEVVQSISWRDGILPLFFRSLRVGCWCIDCNLFFVWLPVSTAWAHEELCRYQLVINQPWLGAFCSGLMRNLFYNQKSVTNGRNFNANN